MAVALRRATREDVPEIVRLLGDDELGRAREDAVVVDAYWRAFDAIDADPRQLLVVAEADNGAVVGTMQLSFIRYLTYTGGERAQIEGVRVDRSLRGSGLGSEMMRWAVDQARRRGCHLVQLTTNKERPDAKRFYERLGFTATHEGMKLFL